MEGSSTDPVASIIATISESLKSLDMSYLNENQSEISEIATVFLNSLFEAKPKNVEHFTAVHFSTDDHKIDPRECLPLIVVGPSGSGKVWRFR